MSADLVTVGIFFVEVEFLLKTKESSVAITLRYYMGRSTPTIIPTERDVRYDVRRRRRREEGN